MITFKIDEITSCLKEVATGNIIETEVVPLKKKNFLSKFNRRTGWYINWSKFSSEVEIYALVLKDTFDIQGLIAISAENASKAVHILWASVAPHNNIWEYGKKKYSGVGGHLFAIAGEKSYEYGYGGVVYGEAMDEEIFHYYINSFGAEEFPFGYPRHPYRFIVDGNKMEELRKEYTYEWKRE